MSVGVFFTVVAGLASIVGFWIAAYEIGKRSRKSPAETLLWTTPAAAQFERLLHSCIGREGADVDIVGYSVHAINDLVKPLIRHALEAQRRVRVLILAPSSEGFHEKSVMEASAQGIDTQEFRRRSRINSEREYGNLAALCQQIGYQSGLASVGLRIRAYNQFPSFRGVQVDDQGTVIGSYLLDCRKPGRELPHLLVLEANGGIRKHEAARMFKEWFNYLWDYRARPYAVEGVVFDLYDTLVRVREEARQHIRQKMADLLHIPRERLEELWDETAAASNRGQISSTKQRFTVSMEKSRARIDDALGLQLATMEEDLLRTELELAPGLEAVLSSLKRRGFKLALMSNCSSSAVHALFPRNLLRFFDVVHLSFQTALLKPEPGSYQALLDSLELRPEACVFVGDGANSELTGAKRAGLHTIKLGWLLCPPPDPDADHRLSSLEEVERWLLTLDGRPALGHSTASFP